MKLFLAVCLFSIIVYVHSEQCSTGGDCQHTVCDEAHGWWLRCLNSMCACSHDTFTGSNCTTGLASECNAAHGNRCINLHGAFHCIDNVCHCVRNNVDIGK